jgi:uncharacterized protein (TIRG00374 family)
MKKILIRVTINTLIGVGLIYLWLQFVDISDIMSKISHTNPLTILWVGLCLTFSTFLRAVRLWLILDNKLLSLSQISFLTYISSFLSFIIPIRAGEIAKGVYISNQAHIAIPKALIVSFIDRLIDFVVVISLLGILLVLVPTGVPVNIAQLIGVLVVIMLVCLITVVYYPEVIKKIVAVVLKIVFIKKLKQILKDISHYLIDAFSILKVSPQRQALIFGVSAVSWTFESLAWYMVLQSLGLGDLSFPYIILGTMLMSLSFILPAAPGYLGSLQAAGLLIFGYWLNLDKSIISAATVLMHLSIVIYILVVGIGSLYLLKFDLSQVWTKLKRN